ncbi:MAG: hypothetical protein OES12_07120 [Anaerolineae bacterium]|nr:hypothetical protein [Anaerolineae bacterium]
MEPEFGLDYGEDMELFLVTRHPAAKSWCVRVNDQGERSEPLRPLPDDEWLNRYHPPRAGETAWFVGTSLKYYSRQPTIEIDLGGDAGFVLLGFNKKTGDWQVLSRTDQQPT